MAQKDNVLIRREVVAMCIDSPLYFTMPIRKRLDFLKNLERQAYWSKLREHLIDMINNLS
jgi:hypothetical protein